MIFTDFLTTAALITETESPTLFAFPFPFHLVFAVISFIFFIVSFFRFRKPYQLLLAVGIPLSLLLWLADGNRNMYYGIGILELIILLLALITNIICKPKNKETASEADEKAEKAEKTEE